MATQFASQQHDCGCSPTMSEKNDASLRFLVVSQCSVTVAIEQVNDGFVGGSAVTILENLNKGILWELVPRLLRENDGTLMRIVVPDEPANEAHNNVARCCRQL